MPPTFLLQPLTASQLAEFAASRVPADLTVAALPDAFPPALVAARTLRLISEGCNPDWCATFLIVRQGDHTVVGSCGFKGSTGPGELEIGYGVSPECRRQGAATAGVRLLLAEAQRSGARQVLAEIVPDNTGSLGVVSKLGFQEAGRRITAEGTILTRWIAAARA